MLEVTKIARAYARKTANNPLLTAVDFDRSTLYSTLPDEPEARLQAMLNAAVAVKGSLGDYGLAKDPDIAAPGTRAAVSGRTAITASVPQMTKGGKSELLAPDDLVSCLYADDEPQFAAAYKVARIMVDAGHGKKGSEAAAV